MNRYFKKVISMLLILSMIVASQGFVVFAGVTNNISKGVDEAVYTDIQLINRMGISNGKDDPIKLVDGSKKVIV